MMSTRQLRVWFRLAQFLIIWYLMFNSDQMHMTWNVAINLSLVWFEAATGQPTQLRSWPYNQIDIDLALHIKLCTFVISFNLLSNLYISSHEWSWCFRWSLSAWTSFPMSCCSAVLDNHLPHFSISQTSGWNVVEVWTSEVSALCVCCRR